MDATPDQPRRKYRWYLIALGVVVVASAAGLFAYPFLLSGRRDDPDMLCRRNLRALSIGASSYMYEHDLAPPHDLRSLLPYVESDWQFLARSGRPPGDPALVDSWSDYRLVCCYSNPPSGIMVPLIYSRPEIHGGKGCYVDEAGRLRWVDKSELDRLLASVIPDTVASVAVMPGDYVIVDGCVAKPQSVAYTNGMTARDAIEAAGGAGGPNPRVIVKRSEDNVIIEPVSKAGTITLRPGDRIAVIIQ